MYVHPCIRYTSLVWHIYKIQTKETINVNLKFICVLIMAEYRYSYYCTFYNMIFIAKANNSTSIIINDKHEHNNRNNENRILLITHTNL